jgi:adenine-specific DNA-methyltransferase
MSRENLVDEALQILAAMSVPPAQRNERSALTLLALIDLAPDGAWSEAKSPLVGVARIMDWIAAHYGKRYAPNRRQNIRRQTLHGFIDAGLVLHNPDKPRRRTNSPETVYQISPACLALIRTRGTALWDTQLLAYLEQWRNATIRDVAPSR